MADSRSNPQEIKTIVKESNLLNPIEDYRQFLGSLAVLTQSRVSVEIGVCRGYTTRYLCEAAKITGGTVYGFDVWAPHGLLKQYNIHDVGESEVEVEKYLRGYGFDNFILTTIDTIENRKETESILDGLLGGKKIDFGFIDGCHSYIGNKNDFEIIYPRLSEHGVIAFHDTLMIDGCREFVLDLRTKFFDGKYDIVDLPFGNHKRRVGVTLLVKRSYPLVNRQIVEVCGSLSSPETIENNEREWYGNEIEKYKTHHKLGKKLTINDMHPTIKSGNLFLHGTQIPKRYKR